MLERPDPVNWSTLRYILTSPKHYRHALVTPREDTEALLLGRLTHCMVYEPGHVDSRYLLAPRFHRGQKDETARANGYDGGRESAGAFDELARQSGADIVKPEIYARAAACRDAILADPIAGPMVTGGYSEQKLTWTDPETGIECRGRVDHINGRVTDLKTTRNISPRLFGSDAARYGYHAQLAWYSSGVAANGIATLDTPANIAVENEAPHDVAVYLLPDDALRSGRKMFREALDILARCRERDEWPGVSGGALGTLALPAWAAPIEAEEITLGGQPIF